MQTRTKGRYGRSRALMGIMLLSAAIGTAAGITAYFFALPQRPGQLEQLGIAYLHAGGPSSVFLDSFCVSSVFVLCEFLLGFCSLGQPLEVAVPAVFGLGSGVVMCAVCSQIALPQGLAIIVPAALSSVAAAAAVSAAACESVKLSSRLMSHVMSPLASDGMLDTVRLYCGRAFAAEVLCALSAALRALAVYLVKVSFHPFI